MIRLALVSLLLVISACTRTRSEDAVQSSALPLPAEKPNAADKGTPSAQPPTLAPSAPSSAASEMAKVEPPPAAVSAACDEICSRSRELHCAGQARCPQGCVEMAAIPGCEPPFAALYTCLTAEPVAHWECSEDGVAAIRDGYCEKQQAAAASCVEGQSNR